MTSTRGSHTREALLDAATDVYAREGFHAASLREIAKRAGVNQALIGYHFKSKEGLYLAVFERMVAQMRVRLGPALQEVEQRIMEEQVPGLVERYLEPLLRLLAAFTRLMAQDESESWTMLIIREQFSPTEAFDLMYRALMGQLFEGLACLVQRIRPQDTAEQARLLVVTLVGQALVIRVSRTGAMRLLNWDALGSREIDVFQAQIRRNAMLLLVGDKADEPQ